MKNIASFYKSFGDFIDAYKTFSIPYYQRTYIWSDKDNEYVLRKFYRDIENQFLENSDETYFIGNFATCKSAVNYIVDGQQRLTSLIVLMSCLAQRTHSGLDVKTFWENPETFVISDDSPLAQELEGFLFNKETTKDVNGNVKAAIDIATEEIDKFVKKIPAVEQADKLKGLEQYILDNIWLAYIEFDNEKKSLNYFLNTNSLCIPLTEIEIFYAFISQVINITKYSSLKIDNIKSQLDYISSKTKEVTADGLVEIFLKAYFKTSPDISRLNEKKKCGVGRWMTGYRMDILNGGKYAVDFLSSFVNYLSDAAYVVGLMLGDGGKLYADYPNIYFNYIYNRYTKNKSIDDLLLALFCNRQDYTTTTIYKKGTTDIDPDKLESYFKVANAVLVTNAFNGSEKDSELSLLKYTLPGKTVRSILTNLGYENMFRLNYPTDQQDPKYKIANNQREIMLILAIQEAFLNHTANPEVSMNSYLYDILDPNGAFTIEHLYTKKDFADTARLNEWTKLGKFDEAHPAEYDAIRSQFSNLSLLDRNNNSKAAANKISAKLSIYATSREICTSRYPEYLIQSLVSNSDYYQNENIKALNLPERPITIDNNSVTWGLASSNNDYVVALSQLAVDELLK